MKDTCSLSREEMPEKLVEEISLHVTRNVLHEWTGSNQDCPMYFGRLDFEPKDVEWLITRIGKAYADGELKLPNEARRTWLDEFEGYSEEKYGDYQVIILLPDDFYKEK